MPSMSTFYLQVLWVSVMTLTTKLFLVLISALHYIKTMIWRFRKKSSSETQGADCGAEENWGSGRINSGRGGVPSPFSPPTIYHPAPGSPRMGKNQFQLCVKRNSRCSVHSIWLRITVNDHSFVPTWSFIVMTWYRLPSTLNELWKLEHKNGFLEVVTDS